MNARDPRPGSKTERLVQIIEGLGTEADGRPKGIRSQELAKRAGIQQSNLHNFLGPYISTGRLAAMRVDVMRNGQPYSTYEYRKGCGVPAPDFKPLQLSQQFGINRAATRSAPLAASAPQPAVGNNTGSLRPEPSSLKTPPGAPADTARQTAGPTPPAAQERRGMGPAPTLPVAGAALRLAIDQDGALQLGDEDDPARFVFTPDQVLALGDFLHGTQGVWRA